MKTHSLTHEEVSQRAQEMWRARGCPEGCDTEIWLEAEEQLSKPTTAHNSPSDTSGRGNGNSQGSSGASDPAPKLSATPAETSAKADQQKKAARAPKLPVRNAPKPAPPESGKPVWDKPHSS